MGRSRRLAVDADNSWIFRAYYDTDLGAGFNGTVDHPGADYIVLAYDGSGDDDFGLSPGLFTSLFLGATTFTVWGKGVISLGNPTQEQINFMAAATAETDLALFPGAFIEAGYQDPTNGVIFVGIRESYTEIAFPGVTFTINRDLIQISNGAGVIDLGTGVRLTSADANGQFYRLAGLLQRNGSGNDDIMTGSAAPQTIHGLEGHDTITAGERGSDLFGDGGNDRLNGGFGADRLFGGEDDDTIKGGFGDIADGGNGNDTIIADRSMQISGGDGIDRVFFDFTGYGLQFNIALPDGPDALIASIGTRYSGIERFDITGGYSNDTLSGNSGVNRIDGGAGADVINGGAGSDTLDAGVGGRAPELPVSEFGIDFARAVPIDDAFSPIANASPQAVVELQEPAFSGTNHFFSFEVAAGGHLVVEPDFQLPVANGYDFSLFDAAFNLIATNLVDFPLDVTDLAAGSYVLRIGTSGSNNVDQTGYVRINLSTAVPVERHNILTGGMGDDTFLVHAADDVVIEATGQGTDTVIADLSWTLSANVEKLTLKAGAGAINGMGNTLANTVTGNESANILNGGSGADTLIGGEGSDLLRGDAGADRMEGGIGNDAYRVDTVGDVVIEKVGEGIDKVISSISMTLAANVENLILTGTAKLNGTGNALANQLTGTALANVLNGGAGNDVMMGGAGDDTYYVDSRSDRIYETVTPKSNVDAGGIDTVLSSATYTLAASGRFFVENLTLTGTAAISATGNELANRLSGNNSANILVGNGGGDTLAGYDGDDRLYGGAGDDVLISGAGKDRIDPGSGKDAMTGGAGADTFIFSNEAVFDSLTMATADRISDFSHAERDRIDLRAVDANLLVGGDQAFTFIGTAAFGRKASEIRIETTATATFVVGDLNGDGIADGYIRLAPGLTLVAGDFLL